MKKLCFLILAVSFCFAATANDISESSGCGLYLSSDDSMKENQIELVVEELTGKGYQVHQNRDLRDSSVGYLSINYRMDYIYSYQGEPSGFELWMNDLESPDTFIVSAAVNDIRYSLYLQTEFSLKNRH